MTPGEYQRRMSSRLLLTTLWATLLLLAVEVLGGWANKSLTLLSESLHTLVDGFSTILSLMALNSPQRQMGREVWGHGRTEVAGTLMLCAFLGFTGVSVLLVALQQVFQAMTGGDASFLVNLEPRVLQFTAAMVILNVALGIYSSYQARILENLPLQLNTQHFLKDAWFSILMLMVLLAVWQNQLWLDAVYCDRPPTHPTPQPLARLKSSTPPAVTPHRHRPRSHCRHRQFCTGGYSLHEHSLSRHGRSSGLG